MKSIWISHFKWSLLNSGTPTKMYIQKEKTNVVYMLSLCIHCTFQCLFEYRCLCSVIQHIGQNRYGQNQLQKSLVNLTQGVETIQHLDRQISPNVNDICLCAWYKTTNHTFILRVFGFANSQDGFHHLSPSTNRTMHTAKRWYKDAITVQL